MQTQKIRVLAVDGSALMRKCLRETLGDAGDFEVHVVRDGRAALDALIAFDPDVIAINTNIPALDGVSCAARIMAVSHKPIITISSPMAKSDLLTGRLSPADSPCADIAPSRLAPNVRESVSHLAGKLRTAARLRAGNFRRISEPPMRPGVSTVHRARFPAAAHAAGLVLIGVSTGGPQTLEIILPCLPADFPWPILIAQHMPATFTGAFARRLNQVCQLSVEEVSLPIALHPGCAYVARGEADVLVTMTAGVPNAFSAPSDPLTVWHPSVTRMVESAMACLEPERLIGVMLTGMGNDGSLAMTEMHRRGARTVAEDSSSAVVFGMPGELIKHGGAEAVLPASRIAQKLIDWLKRGVAHSSVARMD